MQRANLHTFHFRLVICAASAARNSNYNPNTRLTLSSRSFMSFCESDPAFPRTRFLSTARIWSQTAFESTPPGRHTDQDRRRVLLLCGEGHYDHGLAMSVDAGQRKNDTRTAFLDLRALWIAVGQIDPMDVAAREVHDKCLAAVSAERASTSSEIART